VLSVSHAWKTAYPGAAGGVLIMRGVANPSHHPGLDRRVAEWEAELRTRFGATDRATLRALPVLQAYAAYYRRFRKTYHVELQLESILLRGKAIPRSPALVGAMVAAELRHQLLTAGHDLAAVGTPVTLDVAAGGERYILLNGREEEAKAGDMMMVDRQGVISSVLHGPDQRTRITPDTRDVLFVVYAPPGMGEAPVRRHLEDLRDAVLLIAPTATLEALEVYLAA
jgi:DNA/RNA-binding domain of Phe-tRNA-synthetase-like protein